MSNSLLELERAELAALLEAGIFNRAPNLASFLKYVCERYFEGEASKIKEYNIAVEALGRPPEFDQKKDSIVRVEAHRLRKRLTAFYETAGASHAVQISIASGQYAPQFLHREREASFVPAATLASTSAWTPAPSVPWGVHWRLVVSASVLVLALLIASPFWKRAHAHDGRAAAINKGLEAWHGNFSVPVSSEFRMLAGYTSSPYVDRQGHRWEADAYFTGGHSIPLSPGRLIEGLPDPDLLHGFREGDFRYDVPLRAGTYELHLYFSETQFTHGNPSEGEDVRSFRVRVNGQTRLDLFEALSEAGAPNRLQVRVFKDISPAADGMLHLQFEHQSGQPFLNALEILPSVPGRIRPIRIAARKTPITDTKGRVWSGDEYVIGGHLVERQDSVELSEEKGLFEGERFGNFSYHLPVAPGKYKITLHFAETYFGSAVRGAPPFQKNSRLFDVRANGAVLLKNFDIGIEAGGPNRGIERVFENVEPNSQGLIVLEFQPVRNYACVNAIEVEETS